MLGYLHSIRLGMYLGEYSALYSLGQGDSERSKELEVRTMSLLEEMKARLLDYKYVRDRLPEGTGLFVKVSEKCK